MRLLEPMFVFATVIEQGSITAAARLLGTSKSWVSKMLSDLESELKTQLLLRTTRSMALTDEGRTFLEFCQKVRSLEAEAREQLADQSGLLRGRIKISAPVTLGQAWMARLIVAFNQLHPQVKIELVLENRRCDLIEEGFDLAIRISQNLPAEYHAVSLGIMRQMVYAAPSYLERFNPPESPADLLRHNCLIYLNPDPESCWLFQGNDGLIPVEVDGGPCFNYHFSMIEAACSGLGLARLPDYSVADLVFEGSLVPLLNDFPMIPLPIYLIYPPTRNLPKRCRSFIDFTKEWLGPKLS